MDLSNVKHTIKLSTDELSGCAFCDQRFGTSIDWDINHLIQHHGGLLLHVGSESLNQGEEAAYYSTVAVVGFESVPPAREAAARFSVELTPQD